MKKYKKICVVFLNFKKKKKKKKLGYKLWLKTKKFIKEQIPIIRLNNRSHN